MEKKNVTFRIILILFFFFLNVYDGVDDVYPNNLFTRQISETNTRIYTYLLYI